MQIRDLILPNTHKKYPACISYSEKVQCKKRYRAIFNLYEPDPISKKQKVHGSFMTYEDAFGFVKEQSAIDCYNKVKNIIIKKDDYYECELTNRQVMLFDFQDIDLVQNYTWRSGVGIAITNKEDSIPSGCFHRCIFGELDEGYEIIHLNNNGYDNRRQNLKIVRKHSKVSSKKKICKKYQDTNKINRFKPSKISQEILPVQELYEINELDLSLI
jgi:hypothetical protein